MIIVWRVLDSCNLSCPFCAYDKRLATRRNEADPIMVQRFVELFGGWARARRRPGLISWLGGEPLLWKPLDALTAIARTAGLLVTTTTNGTTLGSPRSRRSLIEDYAEATISVDGFGDFHDAMRGWPGAFDKLRTGVRTLARERDTAGSALRLRVNVVLMRGNLATFPDLCKELANWGVEEITFNQLGGRDRPEFFPANRLRPQDFEHLRSLLPGLRHDLAAQGVRLLGGEAYMQRIRETTMDLPLPISDCRVADSFMFIDEQGRIAPCSFTPDHFGRTVDDLRTIEDFDPLADWFALEQRRRPSRDCANCPSTQQFSKFEGLNDVAGAPRDILQAASP